MARYQITAPDGKTIVVEGDNPPTQQDAEEIFAQYQASKPSTNEQPAVDQSGMPQLSMYENPATTGGTAKPEANFIQDAVGLAETIGTLGTGATTGTLGYIQGVGTGLVDSIAAGEFGTQKGVERVADAAARYSQRGTYIPKTQAGQEIAGAVGEAAAMLPPTLAAFSPTQLAGASQSFKNAMQVAPTAIVDSAQTAKQTMQSAMPQSSVRSMGAAEVDGGLEAQRRARAANQPVPMQLSKGQATQDFAQQQFERETAKRPEEGAPIREFMNDQLSRAAQNFDAYLDDIGTQLPDTAFRLQTGQKIDEALRKRAATDKVKIRVAYKEAEKAGETNDPVSLQSVAQYLNDNRAEAGLAPIMQAVAKQIEVQGVGKGSLMDGTLQIGEMTLNDAERLRKSVNKFSSGADANNLRVASEIKQLIDQSTEGAGGQKYQAARKLRKQYADNYERTEIIKNILGSKRGSNDRKIALEDIVDRSVMNGSVEDLSNVRRLLQTQGQEGMAAWRELQAATIRSIRDEAMSNVGQLPDGTQLISPAKLNKAVIRLNENGKLEKIFGKKGAEKIKDLNASVKDAFVAQPGSVNTSNTSSAALAALDMMISAGAMVPTPIFSGFKYGKDALKKRAIEKRVQEALK